MNFWDWISAIGQLRALFDQLNDKTSSAIGDKAQLTPPRSNTLLIKARGGQRWRVDLVGLTKEK